VHIACVPPQNLLLLEGTHAPCYRSSELKFLANAGIVPWDIHSNSCSSLSVVAVKVSLNNVKNQ
jgi:hypothetical protein